MLTTALTIVGIAVVGGIAQSVVVAKNFFPALRIPLDANRTWRSRRIFGQNKTLRGALVMTLASGAAAIAADIFFPYQLPFVHATTVSAILFGFVIGISYILGELPNSFLKRQLNIPPGGQAGRWWTLIDQVDSVIGVCVGLRIVYQLPLITLALVMIVGTVVHLCFDWCLYATKVKTRSPKVTASSE